MKPFFTNSVVPLITFPMALLPLCLGLWLDLRGTPASEGLTALLDLYNNVRAQYDRAGLQPPAGSAVGGVLHLAQDLDEAEFIKVTRVPVQQLLPTLKRLEADGCVPFTALFTLAVGLTMASQGSISSAPLAK